MLLIPVGIPGCGKSTLAGHFVEEEFLHPDDIVSPDTYRRILSGSKGDQTVNGDAWKIVKTIAFSRIRHGLDVYLDATNLVWNNYKDFVLCADANKHQIAYIYFDNPLIAQMRNAARGDEAVPEEAMKKMLASYNAVDWTGFGTERAKVFMHDSLILVEELIMFNAQV